MKFHIPEYVMKIIETLNENGYQAYLVGGCVRDSLLGRVPHDFDVTTDAKPSVHKELFCENTVIETGIKHGTVTIINKGCAVEVTTFRTDGEYKDNRRPDKVSFTSSLSDDLSRRDFTINALAYHPESGVIDLFGGEKDLKEKIIRTVGEADRRFSEDALRILRAVRFCSELGFTAEKETSIKIKEKRNLLKNISRERILSEMKKLICGKNADEAVKQFSDVIKTALNTEFLNLNMPLFKLPPECDVRFAALLMGKGCEQAACRESLAAPKEGVNTVSCTLNTCSEKAFEIMRNLKCEKVLSSSVKALLGDIDFSYESNIQLKKFISQRGYSHAEKLSYLKQDEKFLNDVRNIKKENPCLFKEALAIKGKDLLEIGIKGENIGKCLDALLDLVIEEKVINEKENLITLAKAL